MPVAMSRERKLTVHIDTLVRMLFQIQFLFDVFPQKIMNILVVNLKIRGVDQVLHIFACINRLESSVRKYMENPSYLEYVFKGSRNDSSLSSRIRNSLHRETFATASLAVGKYGPIVTLKYTLSIYLLKMFSQRDQLPQRGQNRCHYRQLLQQNQVHRLHRR